MLDLKADFEKQVVLQHAPEQSPINCKGQNTVGTSTFECQMLCMPVKDRRQSIESLSYTKDHNHSLIVTFIFSRLTFFKLKNLYFIESSRCNV